MVTLSGIANLGISSILGSQSAKIDVKIQASPFYDAQKGAVYLKDLKLDNYKIDSSLGSMSASTILPYLNKALQLYFNDQPIYTLNAQNNILEAMVLKTGTSIKVEQGQIVFPLNKSK